MINKIVEIIKGSIELMQKIKNNIPLIKQIELVTLEIENALRKEGKILICGNGGSAADAQHIAAELSGRFYIDRKPLFAEALHTNTSYLTAVANDYSFDDVYSRLVLAKGRKGDVLIGISTSGNSINIVNAFKVANQIGMTSIGFTGESGGKMKNLCKYLINVPSNDIPRIQEAHIMICHIVCEIVENDLFGT